MGEEVQRRYLRIRNEDNAVNLVRGNAGEIEREKPNKLENVSFNLMLMLLVFLARCYVNLRFLHLLNVFFE